MKKRILSAFLVVVMIVGLFPLNVSAIGLTYAVEGGNLYFDPATGTITDCDTTVTAANIPARIDGVSVTAIGVNAFLGCSSLTKITIPDSVKTIEAGAFYDCRSLTKITIPQGVTSIEGYLFKRCYALTEVILPDSVTIIKDSAFISCTSLKEIVIPNGVEVIGEYAFCACTSLTEITVPDSIYTIYHSAFADCSALTDVYYTGSEAQWKDLSIGQFNDELCSACVHFDSPKPISSTGTAYPATQFITIDGKTVELQAYALKDENGYATNYVKLRDVAYFLSGSDAQFNVTWDGAVNIVSETAYVANGSEMKTLFSGNRTYALAAAETRINGATADLEAILLTDDSGGGYTYYKLRDLGQAIGFNVSWISGVGITIATDEPYSDKN